MIFSTFLILRLETYIHVSKDRSMRDEILTRAEKQMMAGGFANLNFGAIAKDLETTRANLHYHFKNKESLAIEVTQNYGMNEFNEFSSLLSNFKGDFHSIVSKMEEFYWQRAKCFGSTGICVCSQISREPGLPDALRELAIGFYRKFESAFVEIIQDAVNNKQVRKDIDVKREATRAHVLFMGIMTSGQQVGSVDQAHKEMSGLMIDWANSLK